MDSATRTSTRQGRAGCYPAERRRSRAESTAEPPTRRRFQDDRPAAAAARGGGLVALGRVSLPPERTLRARACTPRRGPHDALPARGGSGNPLPSRSSAATGSSARRVLGSPCRPPPRSGWLDRGVERPFEDLGAAQLGDIALRGRRLHSVRCERHPASGAASPGAGIHGCGNKGVEMGGHRWLSPLVTH